MRCLKCQYPLWNLAARRCPECGESFAPSQYEFTPGTVRFHCPHCNKAYYGTDTKGHLVPRAFHCVGCSRPIEMDEMALSPAQGLTDEQTAPEQLPWLDRSKKGSFRAFFRTTGWALVRPAELGRSIPTTGGSLSAWWFMLLVMSLGWTLFFASLVIFPALAMVAMGGGARGPGAGIFLTGFGIMALVVVLVLSFITVPAWACIAHGTLRLTGSSRGGLPLTFGSLCYSGGTNMLAGVPFFGWLVAPAWWLVSAVGTVKESQRVTLGRAAVAVLPFPLFCAFVIFAGYIAMVGMSVRAASGAASMARMQAQSAMVAASGASSAAKMGMVSAALLNAANASPTGTIKHPLDLVSDTRIQPEDLIWTGGATTPETWNVVGLPLAQLPFQTKDELSRVMDRVRKSRPADSSPTDEVRVADCVFVAQGIDLRTADPLLWTVIMWPDPAMNPNEQPDWQIWVARADGVVYQLTPQVFDANLAQQNELRAKLGLKPLRHPRAIAK